MTHLMPFTGWLTRRFLMDNAGAFSEKLDDAQRACEKY